jgi:hypothetical protein
VDGMRLFLMRYFEPDEYFDVWFGVVSFHVSLSEVWFDVRFVLWFVVVKFDVV